VSVQVLAAKQGFAHAWVRHRYRNVGAIQALRVLALWVLTARRARSTTRGPWAAVTRSRLTRLFQAYPSQAYHLMWIRPFGAVATTRLGSIRGFAAQPRCRAAAVSGRRGVGQTRGASRQTSFAADPHRARLSARRGSDIECTPGRSPVWPQRPEHSRSASTRPERANTNAHLREPCFAATTYTLTHRA
jgi:hypothetical protein